MIRVGVAFIVTAATFCLLDAVWLGWVAMGFYRAEIGELLRAQPNMLAAAVFYVLYICGVLIFVVMPARGLPYRHALVRGALFGLFTYMTYDLTNLATLRGWSWRVVLADIVWGMFVTGAASYCGSVALSRLERWRALNGAR